MTKGKIKYCNDGQICKHLQFIKGTKGNTDHLACRLHHRVVVGKTLKQRLAICENNNNFEPKAITGDLFG